MGPERQLQIGYFRINCMDCLDRTNVVQSLLAKENLYLQLCKLGILDASVPNLDFLPDLLYIFKNC